MLKSHLFVNRQTRVYCIMFIRPEYNHKIFKFFFLKKYIIIKIHHGPIWQVKHVLNVRTHYLIVLIVKIQLIVIHVTKDSCLQIISNAPKLRNVNIINFLTVLLVLVNCVIIFVLIV